MEFFKEEYKNFELALVTSEYIFYKHKDECDENANTLVFNRKMKLLSNNYFATELFMETLGKINKEQEDVVYMSPETLFGLLSLKESGYFKE